MTTLTDVHHQRLPPARRCRLTLRQADLRGCLKKGHQHEGQRSAMRALL